MRPYLLLIPLVLVGSVRCQVRRKRIVGGREAAVPPEDDPVVVVLKDDHDATVYGLRERKDGFYSFKGIRYAEPPVERYRFQRSRRLRLEGEVNATGSVPPCPQTGPDGKGVIGSEDCLFLNVFSAELPDGGEGLPVIVWIHGGGFRRGSASQYGPKHLVDKKVVVVTIQYRLGSLGFLSTGLKESPGNVGLFDMTLALEWVKEYINFFGGNPNKVTISGQDCGASAAVLLSMSNFTSGLIGGVIAMSGSALSAFAVDSDPTKTSLDLATDSKCPTSPPLAMVRCLQQLPLDQIITADSALQTVRLAAQGVVSGLAGLLSVSPVVDGDEDKRFLPTFLVKSPLDLLNSGMVPKVPLLTGVTKDQTSTSILGNLRNDIENRIRTIPGFFDNVVQNLVKNSVASTLLRPVELTTAITKTYFNIFSLGGMKKEDIQGSLKKIVEASGDALFNLPAFQTARLWGQKAPAFFYSFDHESKKKGGPHFLKGSPLTQYSSNAQGGTGVGHGDDLLFMFDSLSVEGKKDASLQMDDPKDLKVRETFTTMIAEFVKTGAPQVPSEDSKGKTPWPAFSSDAFVSITEKPRVGKGFRFCEMALWAGLGDRLKTISCQALDGVKGLSEGVLSSLGTGGLESLKPIDKAGQAVSSIQTLGGNLGGTANALNPLSGEGGSAVDLSANVGAVVNVAPTVAKPQANKPAPAQNINRGGGGVFGVGGLIG